MEMSGNWTLTKADNSTLWKWQHHQYGGALSPHQLAGIGADVTPITATHPTCPRSVTTNTIYLASVVPSHLIRRIVRESFPELLTLYSLAVEQKDNLKSRNSTSYAKASKEGARRNVDVLGSGRREHIQPYLL